MERNPPQFLNQLRSHCLRLDWQELASSAGENAVDTLVHTASLRGLGRKAQHNPPFFKALQIPVLPNCRRNRIPGRVLVIVYGSSIEPSVLISKRPAHHA